MADDFWNDDVEVCVRHQGRIAVYCNVENYVVIRQPQEDGHSEFDQSIFVEPENVDSLVRALLKVKEEILSSREGS